MDHSYSSGREKLQRVDHSYFLTAKKTPTVVLRKAQSIKEIKDKLPVDQDHSYHRTPLVIAPGCSRKIKAFAPVNAQTAKRSGLKQVEGSTKSTNASEDLLYEKNNRSPEKNCPDDIMDQNSADINSMIHFEHSYFSRSLCDIPDENRQRCSSTTLFHDHAYMSHKPYLLTNCVAELSL